MGISPTLLAGSLAALEKVINEALRLDAGSQQAISDLGEKWFRIDLRPLPETIYLATSQPVRLSTELNTDPDITLTGTPVAILRALQSGEITQDITVTGDTGLFL